MRTIILMILILFLQCQNQSDNKTDPCMVEQNPTPNCITGDYDRNEDPNDLLWACPIIENMYRFVLTCQENKFLKRLIAYGIDRRTKLLEATYHINGYIKTLTFFYPDGNTKQVEITSYSNSKLKTRIFYDEDGNRSFGFPECYNIDGEEIVTCTFIIHGCTSTSTTCITE